MEHDHHDDRGGNVIDFNEFIAACINDVIDGYHDLDDDINFDNQPEYDDHVPRGIYDFISPPSHDHDACGDDFCAVNYYARRFEHDGPDDDRRGESDPPSVDRPGSEPPR